MVCSKVRARALARSPSSCCCSAPRARRLRRRTTAPAWQRAADGRGHDRRRPPTSRARSAATRVAGHRAARPERRPARRTRSAPTTSRRSPTPTSSCARAATLDDWLDERDRQRRHRRAGRHPRPTPSSSTDDDPHWWQDPRNAIAAVAALRDALVAADPGGADASARPRRPTRRGCERLDARRRATASPRSRSAAAHARDDARRARLLRAPLRPRASSAP